MTHFPNTLETNAVSTSESSNLFSIASLVERYGASAESFRNWERQGLIPPARRTPGGHRRYGLEHVTALDKLFGFRHLQTAQPSAQVTADTAAMPSA